MRHWIVAAAAAALLWPASAGAASPTAEKMAGSVAQTLRESGQLKNYRVGVKYEDGVAWLVGTVTSEEQSAKAEQLAGQVAGVNHVVNKLEITPAQPSAVKEPSAVKQAAGGEKGDLLLTMLEKPETAASAPAPLPPMPTAMPKAMPAPERVASRGMPRPMGPAAGASGVQPAQYGCYGGAAGTPQGYSTAGAGGVSYDNASMPGYAWPSYAAHPNYAAVTYPTQYSPAAWPYIGPFYPYPQVPLGWRKVTLEWDDGWWFLDFSHCE
ncbi:BON domain-containing protein [Botrimarina sp.]|uniref:BON domain-containing protein n=1 Tax=Botrimarina sp. TaxID=2795802 RepID=UPI0032F04084